MGGARPGPALPWPGKVLLAAQWRRPLLNLMKCNALRGPKWPPGAPFPGKRIISAPETQNQYGATIYALQHNVLSATQVCPTVKIIEFH